MRTRAAIYVAHGQPLVVDEVEIPDPGPEQVLVKQFASGICHSQLHQLHNPDARTPTLLGHESTGVVAAKGNAVTHVKEGDRVMLTWLPRAATRGMAPPTPASVNWRDKPTAPTGVFTWAEAAITHHQYVVPLDADVPTDVTAIIGCAVMTGCGAAIHTAGVRVNESVAVFGVGGVGLCIIQAAAPTTPSMRSACRRRWNSSCAPPVRESAALLTAAPPCWLGCPNYRRRWTCVSCSAVASTGARSAAPAGRERISPATCAGIGRGNSTSMRSSPVVIDLSRSMRRAMPWRAARSPAVAFSSSMDRNRRLRTAGEPRADSGSRAAERQGR